ncbi:formamidopyrimidine-DNA glycosylase [Isosphaera pallida ATCC 43644]|uniref:Formamidopyrimidine-DNA glycosylase n=1 Tax=Isosphaera pallida (strain ATCC 43644 / DSM 9630 / IS1B) TaxID=575540 RepID=E8QX96_ISOPI|nr:bifunctional DNA-formamidopyrimidine glycosylase/DNA-(apurinic or apyrimidinic site) lyase [Isosphaera pallida]ADV61937.1 formamidopyrimidine-DNA glycosylase [Isosphaera pallida ATCC 43644]
MPELPEVETMARGLRPTLTGAKLGQVEVIDPKLLEGSGMSADRFVERVSESVVSHVGRRGKWLVWTLAGQRGLVVIQPRMTGGFWLIEPDRPHHVRILFPLPELGKTVWLTDARRLGRVLWFADQTQASAAFARSHGPDALEIERDDLAARLARTARGLKPTLMDQKVLAGIGNIYADEICFAARIHPEIPANTLSARQVDRLHAAISAILLRAIQAEGSSFDAGYRTVLGLEGGFLAENAMYGRGGQPCPGCGEPILKTRIAGLIGRPTYFCPICQPPPVPQTMRQR